MYHRTVHRISHSSTKIKSAVQVTPVITGVT
jgi:hypothetical protein